jgi:hypothetical protein
MSANIESSGLTKNPSMILDPVRDGLVGIDATIHSNDDTYSNGQAARCSVPDGVIMETDYYPADTFVGNHLISVIYGSDYTASHCMKLEVWRRTLGENEGTHDASKDVYISHSGVGYNITQIKGFFSHLYEYKFILKTTPYFAGTYVDVDLIQFLRVNKNNLYAIGGGYEYSPELVGLQNFIESGSVNVSNDGADDIGSATVTFNTEFNSTPIVVATAYYGETSQAFIANSYNTSTTGFTAIVQSPDGANWNGTISVDWVAVGQIKPIAF